MSEIISGIYCILNILNNKRYIGYSQNINKRWTRHKNDLRRNKHDNSYLQNAWNKYGEENFEFVILEKCQAEFLKEREVYYIKQYKSFNKIYGYNLTAGYDGSGSLSEEHKNKIAKAVRNRKLNMAKNATSNYLGVIYVKHKDMVRRWLTELSLNKKLYCLGSYYTEIEAALAYNENVKQYFGEDAKLNIISKEEIEKAMIISKQMENEYLSKQSSKYRGVKKDPISNKWSARLQINKKRIYLGSFVTEIEATIAYNENAKKYLGEDAKLNIISEEEVKEATSISERMKNEFLDNKGSKYRGVVKDSEYDKWIATFAINKKKIYLGRFVMETEAALAYNEAASYYLGWKAKLNEISEKDIEEIWR
jgi:group I intron endonuclease